MENQSSNHITRRLVMVPPPFQGHLTPMLQLATVLHSRGFSITVAHTLFNFPNPSSHPKFVFVPIDDGLSDTQISSKNFIDIASTINTNCASSLRKLLVQMIEESEENPEKIACVIYDGSMYFTDAVARELRLPTMVFRISSATNVLAYHALPQLQSNGYIPLKDSKLFDSVPELHPLRFKDLPIFNSPNSESMLQQIAKTLELRFSMGVIWNTADCIEQTSLARLQKLYHFPSFALGPLHKLAGEDFSSSLLKEDYSCISWLDKQAPNSVMYVSLGSIASLDEKELTEMAWGLANSEQHFLWVIRDQTINVSEWIESLPDELKKGVAERGCIVKWAPQKEVLEHKAVGGFWSHCGWNSSMESLWEGIPMICEPYFGDQRVNARMLTHEWRVGIEWSNVIERCEVEKAVRRLMMGREGVELRERATELKSKIRQAVKEGGSSYNASNELATYILSL